MKRFATIKSRRVSNCPYAKIAKLVLKRCVSIEKIPCKTIYFDLVDNEVHDAKILIYNCRAFIRLSAELIGGIPFKFIIYFSAWFRSIRPLTMSKRKKERGPLGTSKNEEKRTFCVELRTS